MTNKQRKTVLVGVVAVVVLLAGAWLAVISPQLSARASARDNATAAAMSAQVKAQRAEELKVKAEKINDTVTSVNRLTAQFPNDYRQGEWLAMMYGAARDAHVSIASLSPSVPVDPGTIDANGTITAPQPTAAPLPGEATTPDPAAVVPETIDPTTGLAVTPKESPIAVSSINMIATGPAPNLVTFLAALEGLQRPLIVSTVKITGSGNDYQLTLTGGTYLTRELDVPDQFKQ